ncbi:hypothetical protein PAECIP111894_00094 [Paenibacillus pseudetheri]|uniref:Uncharacterized protein n=1 Tax=Paenibacillus pseudetheri TaxID=2897682 RepID=A0ABN8F8A8_9BACL|nr:hypothetical protein PAECIP111894_00094 [Paenibacillus pseudetheri]
MTVRSIWIKQGISELKYLDYGLTMLEVKK